MCRRWRAGREGTPMLKVVHDEAEPNEASGSVLDEIVREAARQMLAVALQAEVSAYIDAHAEEVDENGHRLVVRNGHHNEREVITAAGPVPVRAPRVNDKRTDPATGERKRFASAILPAWARKSPRVAEVLPLLYLHGLSSSDFGPALTQFLGTSHGLSAATIMRLTKDWQDEVTTFNKRSLAGTDYVYYWVDGIHLKVRLEQDKVCLLVMIGVRADGTKELIALDDGHRESTESWLDLLRGSSRRGLYSRHIDHTLNGLNSSNVGSNCRLGTRKAHNRVGGPMGCGVQPVLSSKYRTAVATDGQSQSSSTIKPPGQP